MVIFHSNSNVLPDFVTVRNKNNNNKTHSYFYALKKEKEAALILQARLVIEVTLLIQSLIIPTLEFPLSPNDRRRLCVSCASRRWIIDATGYSFIVR